MVFLENVNSLIFWIFSLENFEAFSLYFEWFLSSSQMWEILWYQLLYSTMYNCRWTSFYRRTQSYVNSWQRRARKCDQSRYLITQCQGLSRRRHCTQVVQLGTLVPNKGKQGMLLLPKSFHLEGTVLGWVICYQFCKSYTMFLIFYVIRSALKILPHVAMKTNEIIHRPTRNYFVHR